MNFRTFALACAALVAAVSTAPAPAVAQGFSGAQRDEIGKVVREYLLANPEVIQDAIAELERRGNEAQKLAQATALKESGEALRNSVHGNIVGNPVGDVTLVEFFDYNCGYCKQSLADMQALAKQDSKLRIVLKDLPVLGPESLEASRVALAVKQQLSGDKLFDYHAKLLATRGRVTGERATALAKEMGVDVARLTRDIAGPEVRAALEENRDLSEKLGINGTPAFVIGEEVIPGAVGIGPLRTAVASVRKCGRASC